MSGRTAMQIADPVQSNDGRKQTVEKKKEKKSQRIKKISSFPFMDYTVLGQHLWIGAASQSVLMWLLRV